MEHTTLHILVPFVWGLLLGITVTRYWLKKNKELKSFRVSIRGYDDVSFKVMASAKRTEENWIVYADEQGLDRVWFPRSTYVDEGEGEAKP